jgi:hypothetical protein
MFVSLTPILTAVLVRSLLGFGEEHEAAAFDPIRHLCLIAIAPTEGEMLEEIFSWTTYKRSFLNILVLLKPLLACHPISPDYSFPVSRSSKQWLLMVNDEVCLRATSALCLLVVAARAVPAAAFTTFHFRISGRIA